MKRINFNNGWTVAEKKSGTIKRNIIHKDSEHEIVNLPHDYSIGKPCRADCPSGMSTGYYDGYSLIYSKEYLIPKEFSDENVFLYIDGAYMNSEVYINGNMVAHRPYGYAPYFADLTDYVKFGEENEFIILVNNSNVPNSRWYTGTGLYRNVELLFSKDISISHWGTFIKTESITENDATIIAEVNVQNRTGKKQYPTVMVEIYDNEEKMVAKGHFSVALEPSSQNKGHIRMLVENAKIWDLDNPNLYNAVVKIIINDEICDEEETIFGIRTIAVDVKRGFRLNGKTIKLKGGCIHHDNGILGSASFYTAEYRKIKLHKEHGYNAIRCAHNPPSRELLNACDELGMLVMDEAFDMWNESKTTNDYHMFFSKWWKEDIDSMVLRDRNHPSIIMWSIGNEIPEHNNTSYSALWSQKLAHRVRELDDTRFVTSAINNIQPYGDELEKLAKTESGAFNFTSDEMKEYNCKNFSQVTDGYTSPLDIVGYNYVDYIYDDQMEKYQNRVMCCHESFPIQMDVQWEKVMNNSNMIGDFTWTSFDYIGEAGLGKVRYLDKNSSQADINRYYGSPYPWRLANDADFDICGFDRPQLHYRKIIWGSEETYIAVLDPKNHEKIEVISKWGWQGVYHSWNFSESIGKKTRVEVYSSHDEVELFVNEISYGRLPAGKPNRYKAIFEVEYQVGTIKAVSYSNGKQISEDAIKTSKKANAIHLEKEQICHKGQDLEYIKVSILDEDKLLVTDANIKLTAKVEGEGVLQAFGAADPMSCEIYTQGTFSCYNGLALSIVRKHGKKATLTVSGEGLSEQTITV